MAFYGSGLDVGVIMRLGSYLQAGVASPSCFRIPTRRVEHLLAHRHMGLDCLLCDGVDVYHMGVPGKMRVVKYFLESTR